MNKLRELEEAQMKKDIPEFKIGDTVKVGVKIKEQDKFRTQYFEGILIGRKGAGLRETVTVRRISFGEGVERVFQIHSPMLDKIRVVKKGDVRRAKLFYLRKRVGKEAEDTLT